jgi:hypothetical protein
LPSFAGNARDWNIPFVIILALSRPPESPRNADNMIARKQKNYHQA